jgi:hypothetical protein
VKSADNLLKNNSTKGNKHTDVVCFLLGISQTPGNYPKESIQHLEHGESLKSRKHTDATQGMTSYTVSPRVAFQLQFILHSLDA